MIVEKGDKVCYIPYIGANPSTWENGVVKVGNLIDDPEEVEKNNKAHGLDSEFYIKNYVMVVFKCNNDWDNYMNYTAAKTNLTDLKFGWIDKNCFCASGQCSHCFPASDDIVY